MLFNNTNHLLFNNTNYYSLHSIFFKTKVLAHNKYYVHTKRKKGQNNLNNMLALSKGRWDKEKTFHSVGLYVQIISERKHKKLTLVTFRDKN